MIQESDTGFEVHRLFERHSRLGPDTAGIEYVDRQYSYDFLNTCANRLAIGIISSLGGSQSQIGILAETVVAQIIGSLAIWKAGKTAVMLDSSMPVPGVQAIVADAEIHHIVCEHTTRATVDVLNCTPWFFDPERAPCGATENPGVSIDPGQPAMIVYTSGSTGEAKGVVRSHRYLLHGTWLRSRLLGITNFDRVSSINALTFGAGMADVLCALLNGATLVPYSPKASGLSPFGNWLRNMKPTILSPPISFFRWYLKLESEQQPISGCRRIILSGETIYQSDLDLFLNSTGPECQLIYEYGSTEAGGVSALSLNENTRFSDAAVAIGFALEDCEIRIIDRDGTILDAGVVGEIAVVSDHLASGYWRKPELTNKKFRTLDDEDSRRMYLSGDLGYIDENGLVFYLGREDNQVKVRGYRVEIGAIEACMNNLPGVDQAVVVASLNSANETELTAFVQFSDLATDSIQILRKNIASKLAGYMVPRTITPVDKIPLNTNYKVDRKALVSLCTPV